MNSRFLVAFAFLLACFTNNLFGVPLNTDLAGYWPLNQTSGTTAYDASGNGNNGTLMNYSTSGWTSGGQVGGALSFNGYNQSIAVPNFVMPSSSFTISAWVNASSYALWGEIAADWNGSYGPLLFGQFSSSGQISDYFAQSSSQGIAVNSILEHGAIPLNTWVLMSLVYDGSSLTMYQDGQVAASRRIGALLPPSGTELTIGGGAVGGPSDGYWDGEIQDVAIWSRALSQSDVTSIYDNGLAGNSLLEVPETGRSIVLLGVSALFLCGFDHLRKIQSTQSPIRGRFPGRAR